MSVDGPHDLSACGERKGNPPRGFFQPVQIACDVGSSDKRSDGGAADHVRPQALFGQLLIGLINGSFYALLSLGLAVIFGLLNIINFAHGALYMMGAFVAYFSFGSIMLATRPLVEDRQRRIPTANAR